MASMMTWVFIPLLILAARAIDVTLGTLRFMMVARGNHKVAPLLGFVESFIWILIMTRILSEGLSNPANIVGYAAGFALGNYAGIKLEERISIGTVMVRLIVSREPIELAIRLRSEGYRVTELSGAGYGGNVTVFLVLIKRQLLTGFLKTVLHVNPETFYTVEDVRSFSKGKIAAPVLDMKRSEDTSETV
jgi:uncharacterized protein YebE (UPF0316 family)